MSPALERLLAGTTASDEVERDAPTGLRADAERTVAIDCDAPADERWILVHQEADEGLRDELRDRVLTEALVSAG